MTPLKGDRFVGFHCFLNLRASAKICVLYFAFRICKWSAVSHRIGITCLDLPPEMEGLYQTKPIPPQADLRHSIFPLPFAAGFAAQPIVSDLPQ